MADNVPAVADGRGAATVAAGGAFALGVRVSGPFCPQPVSSKPMVINAAIATGLHPRGTKLSN
jgi:hypothetical protein